MHRNFTYYNPTCSPTELCYKLSMKPFRFKEIVSIESFDLYNSIFWFFMDSMWLFGFKELAVGLFFPTIMTAIGVVFMAQTKELRYYTSANVCWVIVNGFWLFFETFGEQYYMTAAKSFFVLGTILIVYSLILKEDPRINKLKSLRK